MQMEIEEAALKKETDHASGERLAALFNFSDAPVPAPASVGKGLRDLWTGKSAEGIAVPAQGFLWLAGEDDGV